MADHLQAYMKEVEASTKTIEALLKAMEKSLESVGRTAAKMGADVAGAMSSSEKSAGLLGDALGRLGQIMLNAGGSAAGMLKDTSSLISAFKNVNDTVGKVSKSFSFANEYLSEYAKELGVATIAGADHIDHLNLAELAVGALTGKIELASAAQQMLNTYSQSFIALGIAAAIALITYAVYEYAKSIDTGRSNTGQFYDSLDQLTTRLNENREAAEKNAQAYLEQQRSLESESLYIDGLVTKIDELSRVQGESGENSNLLRMYVDMLNDSVDGLNLGLDENTGALNLNNDQIRESTEAWQEKLLLEMQMERFSEKLREQADAALAVLDAEEKLTEASKQLELSQEALKDETTASGVVLDQWGYAVNQSEIEVLKWKTAVDVTGKTLEDAQGALEEATASVGAFGAELAEAGLMSSLHAKEVQEMAKIWGLSAEEIEAAAGRTGLSIGDLSDKIADHTSSITNSFREIPDQFDLSLDELMEIQRKNIERYESFQQNITALSGKLTDEALQELLQLGPGANSILEELISGGEAKWNEYNDLFADKSRLSVQTVENEFSRGGITKAATDAIRIAADAVNMDSSLANAMTNKVQEAENEALSQAATFFTIGDAMMVGIANGIHSGTSIITSAARSAAYAAYEAARRVLDIHSPSKKFAWLGDMSAEGYVEGWKKREPEIETLPADVIAGAVDSAQSAAYAMHGQMGAMYSTYVTGPTGSSYNGGNVTIEQVVVEGTSISHDLDARKVGRRIGDEAARQIRLRGGLASA